eukprot:scaffold207449_cov33-Prasinocladus_malaysianus.AAC.1
MQAIRPPQGLPYGPSMRHRISREYVIAGRDSMETAAEGFVTWRASFRTRNGLTLPSNHR